MSELPNRIWVDWNERHSNLPTAPWPVGYMPYLRSTPARLYAEELLGALREVHRDLVDMEDLHDDPRIKRVTDICAYFLARVEGEKP